MSAAGAKGPLDGKIVLVTGASRGIGRAIAGSVAAAGGAVVLGARDESRLAAAVAEGLPIPFEPLPAMGCSIKWKAD